MNDSWELFILFQKGFIKINQIRTRQQSRILDFVNILFNK